MPLEVRELVIKVTIAEETQPVQAGGEMLQQNIKRAIIKECVEEVLTRLEKRAER